MTQPVGDPAAPEDTEPADDAQAPLQPRELDADDADDTYEPI